METLFATQIQITALERHMMQFTVFLLERSIYLSLAHFWPLRVLVSALQ